MSDFDLQTFKLFSRLSILLQVFVLWVSCLSTRTLPDRCIGVSELTAESVVEVVTGSVEVTIQISNSSTCSLIERIPITNKFRERTGNLASGWELPEKKWSHEQSDQSDEDDDREQSEQNAQLAHWALHTGELYSVASKSLFRQFSQKPKCFLIRLFKSIRLFKRTNPFAINVLE